MLLINVINIFYKLLIYCVNILVYIENQKQADDCVDYIFGKKGNNNYLSSSLKFLENNLN